MPEPATPEQPDVLAAALDYAARGWRVLPIKAGGKHPPIPAWQRAATTDEATIRSWWTGLYKACGVGIACGPMADGWTLFVIDVDHHGAIDGDETLAELVARHKPLPSTVEAVTGSDGRHLFFRAPPGVVVRNSATTRLGAGLDVRGDGGQVVAAPSIHPNGQPYRWLRAPGEHAVAKAPGWLLALVGETPARPEPTRMPTSMPVSTGEDSIAEWVNRTHRWEDQLAADGWTPDTPKGDQQAWTRPGKQRRDGTSAVLHLPDGPFVVFTTTVPALMQPDCTTKDGSGWAYSMFGYLAATRHNGNRSEAARAMRADKVHLETGTPPTYSTWRPPDDLDEGAVEVEEQGSTWKRLDLAAILSAEHEQTAPELLARDDGACLLYRGKINSLFGESGGGKTWVGLLACAQALLAGDGAVFVDLEDSPASVLERLVALGVPRALAYERFAYVRPADPSNHGNIDELLHIEDAIRDVQAVHVFIDSLGEAMSLDSVKPNEDDAVAYWHNRVPRRLARMGPAVTMLDHIVKSRDAPELFAIGSQRKRAAIDGHAIRVDQLETFSRDKAGRMKLTSAKDRHGTFGRGQVVGEIIVTPRGDLVEMRLIAPAGRDDSGHVFRPTTLMERISRWLEEHPGQWSQREVERCVTGKGPALRTALRVLVDEGYVGEVAAPRGSSFTSNRPFRDDSGGSDLVGLVPTASRVPTASPPRPGRGPDGQNSDRVPDEELRLGDLI